jgi:hypothetical protein
MRDFLLSQNMTFSQYAQRSVNTSRFTVHAVGIEQATPDFFKLTMRSTLDNMGPLAASLEPMTLVLQTLDRKVIGNVTTPEIRITDCYAHLQVSQQIEVTEVEGPAKFLKELLGNTAVSIQIGGSTRLLAHGQRTPIELDKSIQIPGTFLTING